MNPKTVVEVEYLRSGQTRSYGPTETEAILTLGFFNQFGDYVPAKFEGSAKQAAKGLIGWVDEGEGNWASTRLINFDKIEDGKWRVLTRSPWLD